MFDNADIYCRASKVGLAERDRDFLNMIQQTIELWKKDIQIQKMNYEELVNLIVVNSRDAITKNNWNINDFDGVSWFIGNFTDIITNVRKEYNFSYDQLFKDAFNKYYRK